MPHSYFVVDVFTDAALAGNPLAVVLDAADIPSDRCQAIAREFNLSETVFVEDPRDPVKTAKLRIFTPQRELPFAGHPTVGTAALLAQLRASEMLARQDLAVVLEETIAPVECIARRIRGNLQASFTLPRLPQQLGTALSTPQLARALGLAPEDLGFARHVPSIYSAGVHFHCVPLAPGAIGRAKPRFAEWPDLLPAAGPQSIFAYSRDVSHASSSYRARMFDVDFGGEDPATGSAVAAFAGALMAFEQLADGDHAFVVEQGFEMGRPSLITLGLTVEDRRLAGASIGGSVVVVAEGQLRL